MVSWRWGRAWFAATALCALAGVAISVITAVNNHAGHFHSGAARGLNVFAFFTTDSNILAGVGCGLLATGLVSGARWFAVLRLTGLVAITVTGVVFHVALAGVFDLATSLDRLGNELVHTVVPLMTVVGWLMLGPRGLFSARVVLLSLIFPLAWLAFTLIRGAIIHWYPYPFIDVGTLGYFKALVNCIWVALLLLGIAAAFTAIDQRLAPASVAAQP